MSQSPVPPHSPTFSPASSIASTPPVLAEFFDLPHAALIDRYALGVENFDRRVFELTDAELDTAFFPEAGVGRWPARVLLGHLADAELAQVHRMRRTVAEENPVLNAWDEHAFIENGLYGDPDTGPAHPIGAFIAAIHTMRKWTAPWLRTLEPKHWARKALHSERGEQSLHVLVVYPAWHLEHHTWFLNRKVELLLSKR